LFLSLATSLAASEQGEKNLRVLPFISPTYSPEMGVLFNTGALVTFRSDPEIEELPRSTIPFVMGVSTTGAIRTSARATTFWLQDLLRINVELWAKIMPDHYWGVGYEAGRNIERGELTTAYERRAWKHNPSFLGRIVPDLYGGLNLDFNRTNARDVSPGMAADPAFQLYGPDNYNAGAGLILQYDSRDVPVSAYCGTFVSGSATFFGPHLGGDNGYQIYDIDYRQYRTLGRSGRCLAWQLRTRIGTGSVPWAEMSQLGTPRDLRGYDWGRYRHNSMVFGIVEYRHRFRRRKPTPNAFGENESRHGAVVWVGTGSIGADVSDFIHWLPNAGLGYRFEVLPRLNLRVDLGFGIESIGFYVEFNEAF
jgi:hypothetical protein